MVSRDEIQAFVDQIVKRFRPSKVILFGSYAYGTPTEDSDVDLMVVMRHRGSDLDLATKMRMQCPRVQQVLRGLAGGYDGGIAVVTNRQ